MRKERELRGGRWKKMRRWASWRGRMREEMEDKGRKGGGMRKGG
jgi:hypothetical protein